MSYPYCIVDVDIERCRVVTISMIVMCNDTVIVGYDRRRSDQGFVLHQ